MRPLNGLYLLRLYVTPEKEYGPPDKQPSASSSDRLKVVCRLRFHGVRAGGISGSARIVGNPPGRNGTDSSAPRATLSHDGVWSTDPEGAVSVAFSLNVESLASNLVGGTSDELTNVTVQFPGTMAGSVFVGAVTVYHTHGALISKAPENGIRALMKELTSPRCAKCHDPVAFGHTPSTNDDGTVAYCSQACLSTHQPHLERLSGILPRYTGPNGARCTATFGGVEFSVWWASASSGSVGSHNLTQTGFNILVDSTNPLGWAYEMRLDVLVDARAGASIAFVADSAASTSGRSPPSDTEVLCQNYNIFEAVIYSAVHNGCGALAAACLNHLFRWCDYPEFVERLYLHYFDLCIGSGWEGQRVISTLGEYTMLVRPMFEGSTVLVEAALKSMTAADFWFRLEHAKGILVTLYNFNGSITFTPSAQVLRNTIVPEQQRQTLLLLARVFIIMAARTGRDFAPKMLKRAEECYRDALDEDKCRNNFGRMGYTCTQLAALYTVFPEKEDRQKADGMREQGLQYLAQANRLPDTTAQTIAPLVTMVVDDLLRSSAAMPSTSSPKPNATAAASAAGSGSASGTPTGGNQPPAAQQPASPAVVETTAS